MARFGNTAIGLLQMPCRFCRDDEGGAAEAIAISGFLEGDF